MYIVCFHALNSAFFYFLPYKWGGKHRFAYPHPHDATLSKNVSIALPAPMLLTKSVVIYIHD